MPSDTRYPRLYIGTEPSGMARPMALLVHRDHRNHGSLALSRALPGCTGVNETSGGVFPQHHRPATRRRGMRSAAASPPGTALPYNPAARSRPPDTSRLTTSPHHPRRTAGPHGRHLNRAVPEHEMSTTNMQGTPTQVLSRSKVSRKLRDAATGPFTPDTSFTPDVQLESIGQPDVNRVVQSFRPLLERLLERTRQGCSVTPLRTIH